MLILFGLIFNKYTIGFYAEDGYIESRLYNTIIIILELALIAGGIYFIIKRPAKSLNIALSLSVFLFVLGLAEIFSVITGLFVPTDFVERRNYFYGLNEPHPELGLRPKANLANYKVSWMEEDVVGIYNTDNQGFRNVGRNYSAAKIYFIGDSFTFGAWLGREKTFFGIIESKLGEPVVSLGVGGYGVMQYKILMNKFLKAYHPDIAVLCIYSNDLDDLPSEPQLTDYYHYRGWNKYEKISYRQKSIFYQLTRLIKQTINYRSSQAQQIKLEDGLTLHKFYGADLEYLANSKYIEVEKVFIDIIELAKKNDIKLLVFLFPSKESVYKEEYVRLFQTDNLRNEEEGYARLCRIAKENGIKCVDLTSVFRSWTGRGKKAYLDKGPHWNEFGNRVAADAILPYIIR